MNNTAPEDTAVDLPAAKTLRLDFFPASLDGFPHELPPGELKATVTDTHLVVSANSVKGPCVVSVHVLDSFHRYSRDTKSWLAVLEDGTEVHIRRADSCGCNSRLRSFQPYRGLPRRQ